RIDARVYKMSKSRGNVINPDKVVDQYGADSMRLYEMFMGPLEAVKPWSTRSIDGVARFLDRVWRLVVREDGTLNPALQTAALSGEVNVLLHRTIKAVTDDLERLRFNTAISQLMVLTNGLADVKPLPNAAVESLILLLSPLAPHIAEELWQRLGHTKSLAREPWPRYDAKALEQSEVLMVVQVNGKVRARITVPTETSDDALRQTVLAHEQVKKFLDGQTVKQFIVVPKRLVNIVI
ncbi:MAG: class I tRNA ligase family protein, partial [Candidatus Omnitrophota bacterium]|nr:class I tRNA ligase family protein [Candidatus Omnitrophota bacterium]